MSPLHLSAPAYDVIMRSRIFPTIVCLPREVIPPIVMLELSRFFHAHDAEYVYQTRGFHFPPETSAVEVFQEMIAPHLGFRLTDPKLFAEIPQFERLEFNLQRFEDFDAIVDALTPLGVQYAGRPCPHDLLVIACPRGTHEIYGSVFESLGLSWTYRYVDHEVLRLRARSERRAQERSKTEAKRVESNWLLRLRRRLLW